MSKLAVITGGIRGIGAAISVALKENGYEVIANYEQNHQLAEEFSKKYDIKVLRKKVCKNKFDLKLYGSDTWYEDISTRYDMRYKYKLI